MGVIVDLPEGWSEPAKEGSVILPDGPASAHREALVGGEMAGGDEMVAGHQMTAGLSLGEVKRKGQQDQWAEVSFVGFSKAQSQGLHLGPDTPLQPYRCGEE